MITVGQLRDRLKDLPPHTPVCVAELEEAFANNVAGIDIVPDARMQRPDADAAEAVELANGSDSVLVLRW